MKANRRKFSAQQKVQILRQHLVEKVPISVIEPSTRIVSAGQTEVGSVDVQPARDNQLKATNCRGGGGLVSTIPLSQSQKTIPSFPMPKKTKANQIKIGVPPYIRLIAYHLDMLVLQMRYRLLTSFSTDFGRLK